MGLPVLLATILWALSAPMSLAQSYTGGWWMDDWTQGRMILGNGNDSGLSLGSTERYCGRPGQRYATMRQYVTSNYPDWVTWYIDQTCRDGYVRVCVYSHRGALACSTYIDYGWVRLN